MKPVIYADTLFLLNFLMNTVILIITEKILTRKIPVFRIVISSAMGGVYSVLMFLTEYEILYSLILKIVILFGLCYMAFGGENVKKATKNFCGFILVNLCMGGAMTALIFLTDFGTTVGAVVCGNGVYLNLSPIILLLGILGTYILLGIYRRMCRRRLYEQSLIKRFEIDYKGRKLELDLFLDTGCRACDPINGKGAIIAEYDAVKLILNDSEKRLINGEMDMVKAYEAGMRVLPFSTVNGDNMVYAIMADCVRGEDFVAEKITVGIAPNKKFGEGYCGLINPEILLREENALTEGVSI